LIRLKTVHEASHGIGIVEHHDIKEPVLIAVALNKETNELQASNVFIKKQ
jgi:hypothetical protein